MMSANKTAMPRMPSSKVKFKIIGSTGKVLADSEKKIKASGKNAEEAADILMRVRKFNED